MRDERSTGALLDVRDLHVEYLTANGSVRAVDGVTFSIAPGEVLGLAGESGSGKSTIAHAVMRVLRPPAVITGGEVLFQGQDVLALDQRDLDQFRWSNISMVFQSAMNALNPVRSVGNQIVDVITAHTQAPKREAWERAAELFRIVGIDPQRVHAYPHQLSGGMRQRAVIALALALNPPLMIMDEPTTALDVVVQRNIMQQIRRLKQEMGFSILFITHDLSLLVEFSDRIAIMYAGELVEQAPSRQLFRDPKHPYTAGLMSSFPPLTGPKTVLSGIPGSPPDLSRPPAGCRFHPRCPYHDPSRPALFQRQSTVAPRLRELESGRWVACHLYDADLAPQGVHGLSTEIGTHNPLLPPMVEGVSHAG